MEWQWISWGCLNWDLYIVKNESDIHSINSKVVVVTDTLSPSLIEKIDFIEWIITEKWWITSHLAIVCRELKIPVITNLDWIVNFTQKNQYSKVITVSNNISLI